MEKTRINLLKETLKNGKVKLNFYFKPEEKEIGKKIYRWGYLARETEIGSLSNFIEDTQVKYLITLTSKIPKKYCIDDLATEQDHSKLKYTHKKPLKFDTFLNNELKEIANRLEEKLSGYEIDFLPGGF